MRKFNLYKILFLVCSVLCSQQHFGQNKSADSILKMADAIYNSLPDSSLYYCKEAQTISKKEGLKKEFAHSLLCEGRYLLLKGDLKLSQGKTNEAMLIFESEKDSKGLGKCYSLKSIIMGRLNNRKDELNYLLKARSLYESVKDTGGISATTVNLAHAYNVVGNYEKALSLLDDLNALKIKEGKNNFFIENNYGFAYILKSELAIAVFHFQKAIHLARPYKMVDSEISALTKLAECYHLLKRRSEALKYLNEDIELSKKNNLIVEESVALKSLIVLVEENKNYTEAYLSLKWFKLLQDSLLNI